MSQEEGTKIKLELTITVPGGGAVLALRRLGNIGQGLMNTGWMVKVDQMKIN